MAKKQQQKTTRKEVKKKKREDWAIEISQTQSDIKSFLEKFKAEVAKKTKEYQEFRMKKKP